MKHREEKILSYLKHLVVGFEKFDEEQIQNVVRYSDLWTIFKHIVALSEENQGDQS